jgi:hypothetical protein
VRLKSPRNAPGGAKPSVELQVVHVVEREPPRGDEPVEWVLFTNLPVDTAADVDLIVDAYHARWLIEELFKALKSGCAFEKRQLETIRSVTNALAVFLPVSWLLLRLRHLSRTDPQRTATEVMSPSMLACLAAIYEQRAGRPLPQQPTCRDVTWAIAALGGHIRNNGEPGFIVLGRGLNDLLAAMKVAEAFVLSAEM